jgi:hypothetical protein
MSDRRKMQIGDWGNGAAILAVGVFLGLAIYNMIPLVGTSSWPLIIIIPVLVGGVFLFELGFNKLVDWIFPNGIKSAGRSQVKQRKPLALLLSLPTGIIIGVVGAQQGVGEILR